MARVPTLDMRQFNSSPEEFVSAVGAAYREFGFCCFIGHGIPASEVEAAYQDFARFFALPGDIKQRYHRPGTGGARGYTPFKIETAKDQKLADLKEFYHIGRERPDLGLPFNIWPEEVPTFAQHSMTLFEAMDRTGQLLLKSMALAVGQQAEYFTPRVDCGNSILRALHYPPVDTADLPAVRAGAHEDIDLITVLVGATDAGLEIRTQEGKWLAIESAPDAIVVNVGDMLQRLTNHAFRSTTHRVVNPQGERAKSSRYSMPFFLHPNPDFMIETLPQCISTDNPNRYPQPISSEDYLQQRLKEIKLS